MKDTCASCLDHIELDMDRYLRQGDYCDHCINKINKKIAYEIKERVELKEDGQ